MKKITLISIALVLVISLNFVGQVSAQGDYPFIIFGGSNSNNGINKSGNLTDEFEDLVFPSSMYNYNYLYSGSTFSGLNTYFTAYIHDESTSVVNYAGKILKSTDGINYIEVGGNVEPLVSIMSDNNGTLVAAGGKVYPGTNRYYSVIMTSKDDGQTFTTTHSSSLDVTNISENPLLFGGSITKVFYLNNTFFTIGNAGTNLYMLKSEDGVNWEQVGSAKFGFISGIRDISPVGMEYSNGIYVIALTDGREGYSWEWIATSNDGLNWSNVKLPISTTYDYFTSLVLVEGEFVVFGNKWFDNAGFVIKSTDGTTWSNQEPTNKRVSNVKYDANTNLFVGSYNNALLYSLDGLIWNTLKNFNGIIQTLSMSK
ncbi:WD40/YVTN/BNR-like repeat-containing protein [Paenibacillus senegalimassiliensis]|uniref:WD40/YVTN/BNR-like repeat-containing protein n=1 Tax=Paenibacillus senegalimassiliensis TaxID=1737426 RepID=UPI00073E2647|nr:hypothetical protein [Paenibacillus senegalimassiliensis]